MRLIFFALVVLFFSSCNDYFSSFPAGKENKSYLKNELIGNWEFLELSNDTNSSTEKHTLIISTNDNKNYDLKMIPVDFPDSVEQAKAFLTMIKPNEYANVRFFDKGKIEDGFLILKFNVVSDSLIFSTIHKDSVQFQINSIADLAKFLKTYSSNSIWNSTYKYIRKKIE
ncbi:MAG: hypothetical protein A2033_19025 [Bacteroidetes bacterium GWA2_31_9]|nr:MAG: hypothetical protein A2033_19025 [Bacteroidetes bacterium GWA2_31_9]